MTHYAHIKPCRRCQKPYMSSQQYKSICPGCQAYRGKKARCPSCQKPMRRQHRTQAQPGPCWECKGRARRERMVCPDCGGYKTQQSKRCAACNLRFYRGPRSHHWKGGRYYTQGYVMLWAPDHPRAQSNGYIREHIKVWMDAHGNLPAEYSIHHLNGVRDDNRLVNLAAVPRKWNRSYHVQRLLQHRIRGLEQQLADGVAAIV